MVSGKEEVGERGILETIAEGRDIPHQILQFLSMDNSRIEFEGVR